MLSGNGFAGARTRDLTWISLKRGLALCKGAERHGKKKKKRISESFWGALTTRFTSGPSEVLSSPFLRARSETGSPEQPLQNTKAMQGAETKAIQSNKHFKDWLSVCRCEWVAVLSQNSRLSLTDSVSVTTDELHRCLSLSDRWAAKMRIFWIFLWM